MKRFPLHLKYYHTFAKFIFSIAFLTCICLQGYAQTFDWVVGMGGTNTDYGKAIAYDTAGNIYVAGNFLGSGDFDPGPGTLTFNSSGNTDMFITKLDSAGNFIWSKQIGGTLEDNVNAIAVDIAGNVYIAGGFIGTVDFDPNGGVTNLIATGQMDIFVAKLTTTGNLTWAKKLGGTGVWENATGIAVDTSGNVYTTGSFNSTVDFDPNGGVFNLVPAGNNDIFISKLDSSGNFVWAKGIGNIDSDGGSAISIDDDHIYLTGSFTGTVDFDPNAGISNLISNGTWDIFVLKMDHAGNYVWAKGMGGDNFDGGYSITPDLAGNIITVGTYGDGDTLVDMDPGVGVFTLTCAGGYSTFIHKLDTSGNFVWAKKFGDNHQGDVKSVAVDLYGNIYTTGAFFGTLDFDPNTSVHNITAHLIDPYITKLSPSGNFQWAVNLGSTGTQGYGQDILIDPLNNVYTTGQYTSTFDFDFGAGVFNLTSAGDYDIFVHKLNDPCIAPAAPTNTTPVANLTICDSNSTTLTASGTGTLGWYTASSGGTYLGGGNSYNTPVLLNTTTYYVQDSTCTESSIRTAITVVVNHPTQAVVSDTACALFIYNAQTYTSSGTYIQNLTNVAGCDSIITLNLTIFQPDTFEHSPQLCDGNSITIGSSVYDSTGTYSDIFIGANGCDSIVITHLTVFPNPIAHITPSGPLDFCADTNIVLTSDPASSYSWSTGDNTSSITPTISGNYCLTITDGNGCSDTICVLVTIHPLPNVSITGSTTICYGDSATLTANGANSYVWSTTETNNPIIVNPTGITNYSVIGTDANNCTNTDSITITVLPIDSLTQSPIICFGESFSVGTHVYTISGTYIDTLVSSHLCDSIVTTNLTVEALIDVSTTTSGVTISANESIATYQWIDCNNGNAIIIGETGQSYTATANGSYAVIVIQGVCRDTSNCITINNVGIEEPGNDGAVISVYPNPSGGVFTIQSKTMGAYSIINELGQQVMIVELNASNYYTMQVDGLRNGIYYLVNTNNKAARYQKIIVAR